MTPLTNLLASTIHAATANASMRAWSQRNPFITSSQPHDNFSISVLTTSKSDINSLLAVHAKSNAIMDADLGPFWCNSHKLHQVLVIMLEFWRKNAAQWVKNRVILYILLDERWQENEQVMFSLIM